MARRAPVPKALWVHGPDGLVVMAERLAQRIKSTATKMDKRFAGADASADMALPEADALPDQ